MFKQNSCCFHFVRQTCILFITINSIGLLKALCHPFIRRWKFIIIQVDLPFTCNDSAYIWATMAICVKWVDLIGGLVVQVMIYLFIYFVSESEVYIYRILNPDVLTHIFRVSVSAWVIVKPAIELYGSSIKILMSQTFLADGTDAICCDFT